MFNKLNLNDKQRLAAEHLEGPALVVAGPGTGKTTTLVARYTYLVTQKDISPERIFVATFTQRAAQEMKQRIQQACGLSKEQIGLLPIGTFHGLCLGLLRQYTPELQVMGDLVRRDLMNAVKKEIEAPISAELLSGFRNRNLSPEEAMHYAKKKNKSALIQAAMVFLVYERIRKERGLVEFEDMIHDVTRLILDDQASGKVIQNSYDYIMVDEYQDLNCIQNNFINALLKKHQNLWVVGDDDQAIYGFRGSDVRYIRDFDSHYPKAKITTLNQHYRGPSVLIDAASSLIEHNKMRRKKILVSQVSGDAKIKTYGAKDGQDEVDWIYRSVQNLLQQGYAPADIAILACTRSIYKPILETLNKKGIAATIKHQEEGTQKNLNTVTVSTIHQAKGLQWKVVFVAGFEAGKIPFYDVTVKDPEAFEEQRRLAYVALTRATESLAVTYTHNRGNRTQYPSRFLYEWKGENFTPQPFNQKRIPAKRTQKRRLKTKKYSKMYVRRILDNDQDKIHRGVTVGVSVAEAPITNDLMANACVHHKRFGTGKILRELDDGKYEIQFKNVGVKIMLKQFISHLENE